MLTTVIILISKWIYTVALLFGHPLLQSPKQRGIEINPAPSLFYFYFRVVNFIPDFLYALRPTPLLMVPYFAVFQLVPTWLYASFAQENFAPPHPHPHPKLAPKYWTSAYHINGVLCFIVLVLSIITRIPELIWFFCVFYQLFVDLQCRRHSCYFGIPFFWRPLAFYSSDRLLEIEDLISEKFDYMRRGHMISQIYRYTGVPIYRSVPPIHTNHGWTPIRAIVQTISFVGFKIFPEFGFIFALLLMLMAIYRYFKGYHNYYDGGDIICYNAHLALSNYPYHGVFGDPLLHEYKPEDFPDLPFHVPGVFEDGEYVVPQREPITIEEVDDPLPPIPTIFFDDVPADHVLEEIADQHPPAPLSPPDEEHPSLMENSVEKINQMISDREKDLKELEDQNATEQQAYIKKQKEILRTIRENNYRAKRERRARRSERAADSAFAQMRLLFEEPEEIEPLLPPTDEPATSLDTAPIQPLSSATASTFLDCNESKVLPPTLALPEGTLPIPFSSEFRSQLSSDSNPEPLRSFKAFDQEDQFDAAPATPEVVARTYPRPHETGLARELGIEFNPDFGKPIPARVDRYGDPIPPSTYELECIQQRDREIAFDIYDPQNMLRVLRRLSDPNGKCLRPMNERYFVVDAYYESFFASCTADELDEFIMICAKLYLHNPLCDKIERAFTDFLNIRAYNVYNMRTTCPVCSDRHSLHEHFMMAFLLAFYHHHKEQKIDDMRQVPIQMQFFNLLHTKFCPPTWRDYDGELCFDLETKAPYATYATNAEPEITFFWSMSKDARLLLDIPAFKKRTVQAMAWAEGGIHRKKFETQGPAASEHMQLLRKMFKTGKKPVSIPNNDWSFAAIADVVEPIRHREMPPFDVVGSIDQASYSSIFIDCIFFGEGFSADDALARYMNFPIRAPYSVFKDHCLRETTNPELRAVFCANMDWTERLYAILSNRKEISQIIVKKTMFIKHVKYLVACGHSYRDSICATAEHFDSLGAIAQEAVELCAGKSGDKATTVARSERTAHFYMRKIQEGLNAEFGNKWTDHFFPNDEPSSSNTISESDKDPEMDVDEELESARAYMSAMRERIGEYRRVRKQKFVDQARMEQEIERVKRSMNHKKKKKKFESQMGLPTWLFDMEAQPLAVFGLVVSLLGAYMSKKKLRTLCIVSASACAAYLWSPSTALALAADITDLVRRRREILGQLPAGLVTAWESFYDLLVPFFDLIKATFRSEPEGEIGPRANNNDTQGAMISNAFESILSPLRPILPDWSAKEFTAKCQMLNAGAMAVKNLSSLFSFLQTMGISLVNWASVKLFGHELYISDSMSYVREVNSIVAGWPGVLGDINNPDLPYKRYEDAYVFVTRAQALLAANRHRDARDQTHMKLIQTCASIAASCGTLLARIAAQGLRCEPTCVYIHGPAGTGKTTIVEHLIDMLALHQDDGPEFCPSRASYRRPLDEAFEEGYIDQPHYIFEELFTVVGEEAIRESCQFMLALVNSCPRPIPKADLTQKGCVFDKSIFTFITSNCSNVEQTVHKYCADPRAVTRRLHVMVEICWNYDEHHNPNGKKNVLWTNDNGDPAWDQISYKVARNGEMPINMNFSGLMNTIIDTRLEKMEHYARRLRDRDNPTPIRGYVRDTRMSYKVPGQVPLLHVGNTFKRTVGAHIRGKWIPDFPLNRVDAVSYDWRKVPGDINLPIINDITQEEWMAFVEDLVIRTQGPEKIERRSDIFAPLIRRFKIKPYNAALPTATLDSILERFDTLGCSEVDWYAYNVDLTSIDPNDLHFALIYGVYSSNKVLINHCRTVSEKLPTWTKDYGSDATTLFSFLSRLADQRKTRESYKRKCCGFGSYLLRFTDSTKSWVSSWSSSILSFVSNLKFKVWLAAAVALFAVVGYLAAPTFMRGIYGGTRVETNVNVTIRDRTPVANLEAQNSNGKSTHEGKSGRRGARGTASARKGSSRGARAARGMQGPELQAATSSVADLGSALQKNYAYLYVGMCAPIRLLGVGKRDFIFNNHSVDVLKSANVYSLYFQDKSYIVHASTCKVNTLPEYDLAMISFDKTIPEVAEISHRFVLESEVELGASQWAVFTHQPRRDVIPIYMTYHTEGDVEEIDEGEYRFFQVSLPRTGIKGDCGTALGVFDSYFAHRNIFGFHASGGVSYSGFVPICQEDIAQLRGIEFVAQGPEFEPEYSFEGIALETLKKTDTTVPYFVQKVERLPTPLYINRESSIVRTPMFGELNEPIRYPAPLSWNDNPQGLDPMQVAWNKIQPRTEPLSLSSEDEKLLALAAKTTLQYMTYKGIPRRTLSLKEAIVGTGTFGSLKTDSAVGWPYCQMQSDLPGATKQKIHHKKSDWVFIDGMTFEISDTIRLAVNAQLEAYRSGRAPDVACIASLKDELRPLEKVKQCSTRIFYVVDIVTVIIGRMLFGALMNCMENSRELHSGRASCAVGLTPGDATLNNLYKCMYVPGFQKSVLALDQKGFDHHQTWQIAQFLVDPINAWYGKDSDSLARRTYLEKMYSMDVVCGKWKFKGPGGMPSGSPLTSHFNSLYLETVTLSALTLAGQEAVLSGRATAYINPRYIKKNNTLLFYGDDSFCVLPFSYKLDQVEIGKGYEHFGLETTHCVKSKTLADKVELEELRFLKREIAMQDGQVVFRLDKDYILDMLNHAHKRNANSNHYMKSIAQTMLYEMALHGREEFEKLYNRLIEVMQCHEFRIEEVLPTYDHCVHGGSLAL